MANEEIVFDKSKQEEESTKTRTVKSLRVKESWQYKVFKVFNTILMIIICAATLYPFLYLVAQSFSSEAAIVKGLVTIFPVDFNLITYKSVLEKGDFQRYYLNTILYSVSGTLASVFFTALLAYPLSKSHLRLNKFFTPFIIFTMYFARIDWYLLCTLNALLLYKPSSRA